MWIAVADKKVLVASKDLGEVGKKAHTMVNREDIPYIFVEDGIHVY